MVSSSARRERLAIRETHHERRNGLERHCRMVLLRTLPLLRKQEREVATPCRGVLAAAVTPDFRGIEHALDPTANTLCRLGLCHPDGPKNPQDIIHTDVRHRHVPDRLCVASERVAPLLPMFRVLPARLAPADEVERCLAEGGDATGNRLPNELRVRPKG